MIWLDGVEYGTAAEIANVLGPDITPAMVRAWARRDGLPAYRDGGRVRYPLDIASKIELSKRLSTRGRPRSLDNANAQV